MPGAHGWLFSSRRAAVLSSADTCSPTPGHHVILGSCQCQRCICVGPACRHPRPNQTAPGVRMFVGVLTAGAHADRRQAARETWASDPRLHRRGEERIKEPVMPEFEHGSCRPLGALMHPHPEDAAWLLW